MQSAFEYTASSTASYRTPALHSEQSGNENSVAVGVALASLLLKTDMAERQSAAGQLEVHKLHAFVLITVRCFSHCLIQCSVYSFPFVNLSSIGAGGKEGWLAIARLRYH